MGGVPEENEEKLRARARQRIAQGVLPCEKPLRTWGGRGSGAACNLCDQPIQSSEPEMELEYESTSLQPTVRFHLRCQTLWDQAREVRQSSPSQWTSVNEQLPPLRVVVEARVSLSGSRSIILNVMRVCDGETGPVVWLNATTNSQLPDLWAPLEWRPLADTLPVTGPNVAPGLSRRA